MHETSPTPVSNLPAVIDRPLLRSAAPVGIEPGFLSQLIAEREHYPTQSALRRAPIETALGAYKTGLGRAVRRMPSGYRTSLTV